MRNCIVSVIRNTDVRTLFAHSGATRRYRGRSARSAALALARVRPAATAYLHRRRCAPCATLRSTLPLPYASKDSPAC
ncbi:magnesium transporter [Xanthomonas euvesicatoria pv. citrumelonis]|nr:magnesium transporter [Xanthomonas euvesicatoria]PPU88657.1 magnesium transporter [Xanthomonas euvesicatoria pv. citrumelonis]